MKLCFSTLGCPGWDWSEILASAKDLGYQGIELRGIGKEIYVPHAKPFQPSRLEATRRQLENLGLTIPCITSACDLHIAEKREDTLREGRAYIDLAEKLNAPYIRVLGDPNPEPGEKVDVELVKESLGILGDYAAAKKVTILLETNGYFADSERTAKLMEGLNHPAVAVLWDIHHPYRFIGEKPSETYSNLKRYIQHVHLKDSNKMGENIRYAMLGNGDLPVEESVHVLQDGGYQGFYSLEWVKRWDLSLEEPGIVFAHYIHYMRNIAG